MVTNQVLNRNDKRVLALLLDNARVSDAEIAKKVSLTPQGVRKIRKRLEKSHIAEYRTIVSYTSLGIGVFIIAHVFVKDSVILLNKHIIGAFEVNESQFSHILIFGFSSVDEWDSFKHDNRKNIEIQRVSIVSQKGMLKNSPVELIKEQLRNII